ncbi:ABC transporter ATP-binding protein [Georgenia yuyongxinii]|uniref:ABC transporter ATP-binding protein n=1 Tax=Georgenia yuyongxinii TaxID=2589797 RepID=A0A552WRP8_9MICO|nr:ABC transporter ATP-binding protein [Georgenia yuyongxinii]TRW45470.1 ABC transporter ATP-binding protein [Georgenia yuyongxinii]
MSKPTSRLLVRATGLEVGYGVPVCAPISFALATGEVLAVVGVNGTGKSTLLRTVVGQLEPVRGRVEVLGTTPDDRDAAFRTDVAVDLGDDAFFPALTVREHLLMTCYGHGVADAADVAARLLEEFGLTARSEALPAALSSGQRRRLLLAAAFARPRELLVLDEPEQRLDAGMRARLTRRLVDERRHGRGVLIASHDPAVVAGAATAVLLIDEDEVRPLTPAAAAAAIESM